MTSTSALIHTYLLSQSPHELLQQSYAKRDYTGMAGAVLVEYSTAELPAVSHSPRSQSGFAAYQQEQSAGLFTPWVAVPQEVDAASGASNGAERDALEDAAASDFSARIRLASLRPDTRYSFRLWTRGTTPDLVRPGRVHHFTTAPDPTASRDVSFIATTCFNHGVLKDLQSAERPIQGFRLHRAILDLVRQGQLSFDFAVINGDTVYLDKQGHSYRERPEYEASGMRARFLDNYLLPLTQEFFRQFPAYFQKDDHDWRFNDADPVYDPSLAPPPSYRRIGKFYRGPPGPALGKSVFEEMHPVERGPQAAPYRTFRWGRGLQIWLLESRECRHPNARNLSRYEIADMDTTEPRRQGKHLDYPDYCGRPDEDEAWGPKQFAWLTESLKDSDAYFKIIISPTPVLGPDQNYYPEISLRPLRSKADNHVRRFRKEFSRLLEFLQREQVANVYFVSGDRHFVWHSQYQARDGKFTLHEFGSGPFADDIVPFGDVFYKDERGTTALVAAQPRAGFVHVQVIESADVPTLRVEWYTMEDWRTSTVRRWKHSFEAPLNASPSP